MLKVGREGYEEQEECVRRGCEKMEIGGIIRRDIELEKEACVFAPHIINRGLKNSWEEKICITINTIDKTW